MTWPFENDTHKVEKKLATQSLSANKQRNFLAGIIMFIASLLLAFSTILLCNATIDTQIISRVDNTQEILSVILGIAIVLLLTARSEEHTSELRHSGQSRMPSSA